jgi:hypothetical protein
LNDLNRLLSMRENTTQTNIKRSSESLSHGEIAIGDFLHTLYSNMNMWICKD